MSAYHYTKCGLDNVWLANGFSKKQTAYGEAVAITHANALHKRLAENVINKHYGSAGGACKSGG